MLNVGDKVIPVQMLDQCNDDEHWKIDLVYYDKKDKEWLYCIDDLKMWLKEDELIKLY